MVSAKARQVINSIKPNLTRAPPQGPTKQGSAGYDNPRDDIEKTKKLREGSIEKVPVNGNDITNKTFIDAELAALIATYLADHPHQDITTSATPTFGGYAIGATQWSWLADDDQALTQASFVNFSEVTIADSLNHKDDADTKIIFGVDTITFRYGGTDVTAANITTNNAKVSGLWEVDGAETRLIIADEIDMQTKKIINLVDPTANQEAATKKYHDDNKYTDAEAVTAVAAVGGVYVDRGDPAADDFAVGNFTTNGAYQDLDLSGILPSGATAVCFRIKIKDGATNSWLQFRKKGNTNNKNQGQIRTQVINIFNEADMIVSVDANRKIQYVGAAVAFTNIDFCVKGWFI